MQSRRKSFSTPASPDAPSPASPLMEEAPITPPRPLHVSFKFPLHFRTYIEKQGFSGFLKTVASAGCRLQVYKIFRFVLTPIVAKILSLSPYELGVSPTPPPAASSSSSAIAVDESESDPYSAANYSGPFDCFELQLTDGDHDIRCILAPRHSSLVRSHELHPGCFIEFRHASFRKDESNLDASPVVLIQEVRVIYPDHEARNQMFMPEKYATIPSDMSLFGSEDDLARKIREFEDPKKPLAPHACPYFLPMWDLDNFDYYHHIVTLDGLPTYDYSYECKQFKELPAKKHTPELDPAESVEEMLGRVEPLASLKYDAHQGLKCPPVIGRVTEKSKLLVWSTDFAKNRFPFTFSFLITDKSLEREKKPPVSVSVWNSVALKLFRHIKAGDVIVIKNFRVAVRKHDGRGFFNDMEISSLELKLNPGTKSEPCAVVKNFWEIGESEENQEALLQIVPTASLNQEPLSTIRERPHGSIVDLIAIVTYLGRWERIAEAGRRGQFAMRRLVRLIDASSPESEMSLILYTNSQRWMIDERVDIGKTVCFNQLMVQNLFRKPEGEGVEELEDGESQLQRTATSNPEHTFLISTFYTQVLDAADMEPLNPGLFHWKESVVTDEVLRVWSQRQANIHTHLLPFSPIRAPDAKSLHDWIHSRKVEETFISPEERYGAPPQSELHPIPFVSVPFICKALEYMETKTVFLQVKVSRIVKIKTESGSSSRKRPPPQSEVHPFTPREKHCFTLMSINDPSLRIEAELGFGDEGFYPLPPLLESKVTAIDREAEAAEIIGEQEGKKKKKTANDEGRRSARGSDDNRSGHMVGELEEIGQPAAAIQQKKPSKTAPSPSSTMPKEADAPAQGTYLVALELYRYGPSESDVSKTITHLFSI